MEFTEQKLTEFEKRAMSGGFTFMWPSEVLGMVEEIRKLRKSVDDAEWNEELALMALDSEIGDRPIKPETIAQIEQVVADL